MLARTLLAVTLAFTAACSKGPAAGRAADSARADSVRADSVRADSVRADSVRRAADQQRALDEALGNVPRPRPRP